MKTLLQTLLFFFVISSYVFSQGTYTNITFFSNSLETNRYVQIYLPEGYNPGDSTRYPVIYLLHGASGDHLSFPWLRSMLDTLIGNNYISPVIVVKPDGSIAPWGVSMYTNSELNGNFEDYIVFDLVEFIDSAYKTITNREKRAIWGASMGGFGSIKLALKHPDLYCVVGSHSGFLDFSHCVDWVPAILNENGGPPVNEYIPSADTFTWLFYICAAAFSPNLSNPPYYVDFPLDSMGNFIDSVFNRWQLHNPVRLAANLPSNSDLAIYFDCGMQDEVLLYPFNTGFADSLDLLGIDYVFESFNGTHTSEALSRVPIALRFLDSVMNPVTEVFSDNNNIVSDFNLFQNYPNPFNPTTKIKYSIPKLSFVTIKIYDVLGSEVATLVNEEKPAGSYEVEFKSTVGSLQLASGIYFYRLKAIDPESSSGQGFVETKKMILTVK